MNAAPHFIGDEAGAAGYRLAGFEVRSCGPDEAPAVLDEVLSQGAASLVLLAAPHARHLGEDRLLELMRACDPPVAVVRDAAGTAAPPDLARRVRAMLGVGA